MKKPKFSTKGEREIQTKLQILPTNHKCISKVVTNSIVQKQKLDCTKVLFLTLAIIMIPVVLLHRNKNNLRRVAVDSDGL